MVKKDQQRDITTIGLKTVIAEVPLGSALATSATSIIAAKMVEGAGSTVRRGREGGDREGWGGERRGR